MTPSDDPMIQLGKIKLPQPKKRRPKIKELYGTVEIPPSTDAMLNAIIDENNALRSKLADAVRFHSDEFRNRTALQAKLAAAEAALSALPKTADGVTIVPGMEVWQTIVEPEAWIVRSIRRNDFLNNALMVGLMTGNPGDGCSAQGWQLYSTHEAAAAALADQGIAAADLDGKGK